jgi:hypothetical protein
MSLSTERVSFVLVLAFMRMLASYVGIRITTYIILVDTNLLETLKPVFVNAKIFDSKVKKSNFDVRKFPRINFADDLSQVKVCFLACYQA